MITIPRKKQQIIVLSLAFVLASRCIGTALAQPSGTNLPIPITGAAGAASKSNVKSITGRISSLDITKGTFTIRAASGESVHLKGSKSASPASLRKGERVVVTYEDGVALSVQATRATR
jgi:hypothetical protein